MHLFPVTIPRHPALKASPVEEAAGRLMCLVLRGMWVAESFCICYFGRLKVMFRSPRDHSALFRLWEWNLARRTACPKGQARNLFQAEMILTACSRNHGVFLSWFPFFFPPDTGARPASLKQCIGAIPAYSTHSAGKITVPKLRTKALIV